MNWFVESGIDVETANVEEEGGVDLCSSGTNDTFWRSKVGS